MIAQEKDEDTINRKRGIEAYYQENYSEAALYLEKVYNKSNRLDYRVGVFLGWSLAQSFQLNSAEILFREVLNKKFDAPGAAHGYWFTLNALGKYDHAIDVAIKEVKRGFVQFTPFLCGSLVETGNLNDAKKTIDDLKELKKNWPETWDSLGADETLGELWSALKDWKQAALSYRDSLSENNKEFSPILKLLRACSRSKKNIHLKNILDFCKVFLKINLLPTWTKYQLVRFNECKNIVNEFKNDPEKPIMADFNFSGHAYLHSNFSYHLTNKNNISSLKEKFKTPIIDSTDLENNIKEFKKIVTKLIMNGRFKVWESNFLSFKKAFGTSNWRPVFVLSTGRCGTESLHHLLKQSNEVIAHHNFQIRSTSLDRNHLLYRIIEGKFDELIVSSILLDYLESRAAEFLYAVRKGRTFVSTNHYDTIFAPFCSVLFPESCFIYMSRNETNTFKSFYGKNQWRNRQLQFCHYDPNFLNGQFRFFLDNGISPEASISWYLYITKAFSNCFLSTLPSRRFAKVTSEHLFKMNKEEFNKLSSVFPNGAITDRAIKETYAVPRNSKDQMLHIPNDEIKERSKSVKSYIDNLENSGVF